MSAKTPPSDFDQLELYTDQKELHDYNFKKHDRIWRVLKYGEVKATLDRHTCVNYEDYWVTLVENGPQKQVVAAYQCDEWPSVDLSQCSISDHAENQMRKRGIPLKNVYQLGREYIVYDRSGKNRYRLTGMVWGDKLNVILNVRTNTIVTAYYN